MSARTALIVGASGLVGGECLRALLERPEYDRVVALVRRPLGIEHRKLIERVVDFAGEIETPATDDVYCALGAPLNRLRDHRAFDWVDHDLPLKIARVALAAGARRLAAVTSVASEPSSILHCLRVKGAFERKAAALPFETTHFHRPSFLIGRRRAASLPERLGEPLTRVLGFALRGPLSVYREIPARTVGEAMVGGLLNGPAGRRVFHYGGMLERAATLNAAAPQARK